MVTLLILQLSWPVNAAAPNWGKATGLRATENLCGNQHSLILKGKDTRTSPMSNMPGCTSSEVVYDQLIISETLLAHGNGGPISVSGVDSGAIHCSKGKIAMIIGAPGQVEQVIREHPVLPNCTYVTKRYEHVSSLGKISFVDTGDGRTMTIAESLAAGAKERALIIAQCNANPACRAEMARMSSGSRAPNNPCGGSSGYPTLSGGGRCVDSKGNADPQGTVH